MNPQEFFTYIQNKYTRDFATFLCEDLLVVNQLVLINTSLGEILETSRTIFPNVQETSSKFYIIDDGKKNSGRGLKPTVINMIKLLKKEFVSTRNKRSGDVITTSTTETELNSDEKENHRKKTRTDALNGRLSEQRRRRQRKEYTNNNNNHVEWSFSSDEDYQPPLLDQLYPSFHSSHTEVIEFDFITMSRLDYFCEKYLCLNRIIAVREFQHAAQVQLHIHRENLYEFLRFIRRTSKYLAEIQETARKHMNEDMKVQIKELVNQLIAIRNNSNFVFVGFVPK